MVILFYDRNFGFFITTFNKDFITMLLLMNFYNKCCDHILLLSLTLFKQHVNIIQNLLWMKIQSEHLK